MKKYDEMSKQELEEAYAALKSSYDEVKKQGLTMDMSRGKPSVAQLNLSRPLLDVLNADSDLKDSSGIDCRNYGVLDGISDMKQLFADLMGAKPENVIVYGASSLNVMYDTVARSIFHGVMGETPWFQFGKVKFLCPVPGYDRHFGITEAFGIDMVNVPMNEDGPDMDMVEKLVSEDASIKGIWCVPKYSNPTGYSFSDETVRRFAALKPAARDFRIYWDNAYCIHHLYEEPEKQTEILNIIEECEKAGNPDMVYEFVSTSKITFPGSGVAALVTSEKNAADIKAQMKFQTIGHDKLNQLRHARFFGDVNGLMEHMMKHAEIMRPKFEVVLESFEKELAPLGIAQWTKPLGGYFISIDVKDGCAKRVVSLCKEAGLVLTGAGATYPYGKDPQDANIRIAPSFPTVEELRTACEVLVLCVKFASAEKLLQA